MTVLPSAHRRSVAAAMPRNPGEVSFAWIAAFLTVSYTVAYFAHPAAPGRSSEFPLGWLGWWDQSKYIESAKAFGKWDLSPTSHWYPFGYDLLIAPFTLVSQSHAFFLPGLIFLILSSWLFLEIASRYGLSRWLSIVALAIGLCPSWMVFKQHAIPWNTSLGMLLFMVVSYAYVRLVIEGAHWLHSALLGGAAAALVFTRPADVVALAPFAIHAAFIVGGQLTRSDGRKKGLAAVLCAALAFFVVAVAGATLHVLIHGWGASEYMRHSSRFSLIPAMIPFRAYVMLISPIEFFGSGIGIIPYMPWVGLGLLGLVYTGFSKREFAALNISAAVLIAVYLSYPDWWPGNVWRFNLIHYLVWPLLLCGLFALSMVQQLFSAGRRGYILVAAVIPVALGLVFKYSAAEVTVNQTDRHEKYVTVTLAEPQSFIAGKVTHPATWKITVDYQKYIEIDGKRLFNLYDYHSIPTKDGFNFVFNTAQFGREITISAPSDSTFAKDVTITPLRGVVALRMPGDWAIPDDWLMP